MLLWADEEQFEGAYHTNFKLSALGEDLIFSDSALNTIDQLIFPALATDLAYARIPNGIGSFVVQQPTFGRHNGFATVVSHIQKPQRLVVYPNPTEDWIYLKLDNPLQEQVIWDVFDSQGGSSRQFHRK